MSGFYNRVWEISLNGKPFIEQTTGQQFKITFDIINDFGAANSYADIAIYNLSQDTIAKVLKRDVIVTFRAGYEDSIDVIFEGGISNILKERVGPDVITRIIAQGTDARKATMVNTTLGVNTTVIDAIKLCADATGHPLVIDQDDFKDASPFAKGYILSGDPYEKLDELSRSFKFDYNVENGKLIIVGKGRFRKGTPIVIDQFSGMEGIPEITEAGCDVKVRLSPRIKIGRRIDIQSELRTFNFSNLYFQDIPENAGKGIYVAHRLRHTGDSKGDTWTTSITAFR